ncbi:hypothetical protein ACVBEF_17990 [Glaciimonas sp. GG7]
MPHAPSTSLAFTFLSNASLCPGDVLHGSERIPNHFVLNLTSASNQLVESVEQYAPNNLNHTVKPYVPSVSGMMVHNGIYRSGNKNKRYNLRHLPQPKPLTKPRVRRKVLILPPQATPVVTQDNGPRIVAIDVKPKIQTEYTVGGFLRMTGESLKKPFTKFAESVANLWHWTHDEGTPAEEIAAIQKVGAGFDMAANLIPDPANMARQSAGTVFDLAGTVAEDKQPSLDTMNDAALGAGNFRGMGNAKLRSPGYAGRSRGPFGKANKDGLYMKIASSIRIKKTFYNVRTQPGGSYEIFNKDNGPGIPVRLDIPSKEWVPTLEKYAVHHTERRPALSPDGLIEINDKKYVELKRQYFRVAPAEEAPLGQSDKAPDQTPAKWEIFNENSPDDARIPVTRNAVTGDWQETLPPEYEAVVLEGDTAENERGIIVNRALEYIEYKGQMVRVTWDADNGTYRLLRSDRPGAPGQPMRYKDGLWGEHRDVGLRGGGARQVKQQQTVNVNVGQMRIVTGNEILSTLNMKDCSTFVVLNKWNAQKGRFEDRVMGHIVGSHLNSLMATKESIDEAGKLLSEVLDRMEPGKSKVIIAFGPSASSRIGRTGILRQEYKNQPLLQQCIDKAEGNVEMYIDGSSITVLPDGEVRTDPTTGEQIQPSSR